MELREMGGVMNGHFEKAHSDSGLVRYFPKIVYVLSGGTPKAFCHLGMIEALENRGIVPDLIVGTSAGSLAGALYSHFANIRDVYRRIEYVLASEEFEMFERKYFGESRPLEGHVQRGVRHFFSLISETLTSKPRLGMSFAASAMIAEKDVLSLFEKIFEGITFDTLKIPFAAVAVDLTDGVPFIFAAEKVRSEQCASVTAPGADGLMKAVMASSAIPLLFPTVQLCGHMFVDGGVMTNLPVREARGLLPGQEVLLAGFDASSPLSQFDEEISSVESALGLLDPAARSTQSGDSELADILFQPAHEGYPRSSFTEYKKYIDLGRAYMTRDRLSAFERVYREKCASMVRNDKNAVRRFFATAKLRQQA
jgi:NTE family protein